MKGRRLWLCAAAALALCACDRKGAAERPAAGAKAAAAQAAAELAPAKADASVQAAKGPKAQKAASVGASRAGLVRSAAKPGHVRTASFDRARTGRAGGPTPRGVAYAAAGAERGPEGLSAPVVREATYSAEYHACVAGAAGFTMARADCHSAELARQGARLSEAYEAASAGHSEGGRERLEAKQRRWMSERDAACRYVAARGDADLLQEGACRLDMTIRRADGLVRDAG